ncbi:N-6 DNA methylase [Prevotella copri]|uniref:site-specific DNA-methyltransferase (adenine-specific) n=1 Tax=Segatella copri TaxID=165179 RepID=A0A6I2U3F5_9BACT|nr:N-6 DNA methylase [Segatella copri]MST78309.1 N-6 DNA methylase [Segatella copri]
MITKDNIQKVLLDLKFFSNHGVYTRHFGSADEGFDLEYNYNTGKFNYPVGLQADRNTTQEDYQKESYVVFVCVAQLFERGYLPQHIKLEGRNYAGTDMGYCDILVSDNNGEPYLIVECKKADIDKKEDEFRKHWAKTMRDGDQLFRYFNTYRKAQYLCMYAADYPEYSKKGKKINRLEINYHIISLVDNEEYLQTDNKLRSFQEMREQQGGSEDFFNVWKQTYKQDFTTRGLFEEGIDAFNIGKKSYGINDLKTIDEYSLDKKYNEFALILRKHTISSHENAFDKLVNLFLAKIIDERYHSDELQLLWKGAAYDDYFSLQDRLINLYKRGMKEFFDDEVASVENAEIENAFKFLTSKADEARDTIKRYFRKLKYFNNNPFAFLDVHNEQLFYKNAVILKDTISMLQDIYLTKNTDNQFLGDLFEGFLNRGVHQSEGQFFTPIPIVRFLVSSLPLRHLLEGGEIPKVIDYACGAGHFLTEYARQIKPIVEEMAHLENIYDKRAKEERLISVLREYYEQIVGIEKDYRLSKVSQVAAFMYGMDGIHIHYGDGLQEMSGIQDHTFSVLVANPPYSVSGFLETLPEEDRERYTLNNYISNIEKNNSIETFFIERAAQLLKSGGVAAIVLPSSILTKGGLYMRTRELLLKNFDIVSICSLGPNTFGQTNTSTIVLFLRRKALEPDLSKHLLNRIAEWFEGNMVDNGAYKDSQNLDAYIKHMGYKHDDYIQLLKGELTDSFMDSDMAKEYVKALNIKKQGKNTASTALAAEAKKVRDEAQKFVKSRAYVALTPAEKLLEEKRFTLKFIREIEKEKLYFYMLAASNPQPVLVVESPSDKSLEKKFLGYEWSNRKGAEGIHYLNTVKIKDSSSDDEVADDDTIEQIKGIEGIMTPLFNPLNLSDNSRLNSLICNNFEGNVKQTPEEFEDIVHKYNLVDMLSFTRVEFDKVISTSVAYKLNFESKYPLVSLIKYVALNPSMSELKNIDDDLGVSFVEMVSVSEKGYIAKKEERLYKEVKGSYTYFAEGDLIFAKITPCMENGKCAIATGLLNNLGFGSSEFHVFRCQKEILNTYLFALLNTDEVRRCAKKNMKGSSGHRRVPEEFYSSLEIPLPPMDIQKKIAEECEKVNSKMVELLQKIQYNEERKLHLFEDAQSKANRTLRLDSAVFNISIGRRVLKNEVVDTGRFDIYSANVFEPFGKSEHSVLNDFSQPSVLWGIDGDWMVNFIDKDKLFCPTDHCGVIRVLNENEVLPRYLVYPLQKEGEKQRFSRANRASTERIRSLIIQVPSIEVQKEVVEKLSKIDEEISKAKQYVANASSAKQAILDKYLK